MKRVLLALVIASLTQAQAQTNSRSNQPYIDLLKRGMEEQEVQPGTPGEIDPYIQSIKKKNGYAEGKGQSYIDHLRRTDPEAGKGQDTGSYSESQKQALEPKPPGGAIEAVREGKSTLEANRGGEIHHAFGIRYGASANRTITASSEVQQRGFSDVYGGNSATELGLFYEYQPYHSEWFGNIGIYGSFGLAYFHGVGTFEKTNLTNPVSHQAFSSESETKLQFFTLPVTIGIDYRFNLLRIIRPFVIAGPSLIGYVESRNDDSAGHRGFSRALSFSGGANVLLDWISRGSAWDLYSQYDIKHYYLTVEYMKVTTLAGDVNFATSGINAGLTFEF